MGVIRKTLSIGTLGVVSFRSKKEQLRRAERSQRGAEMALEAEHSARLAAEDRITKAEKRLKRANAEAAQAATRLEEAKRRDRRTRRTRRKDRAAEVRATLEPMVRSGVENVRHAGADATKRGRRASRHAREGRAAVVGTRPGHRDLGQGRGRAARRAPRGPRR